MDAAEVISTITQSLEQDTRVRALLLSGSHGNGLADAHSDIDFILITDDGPTDDIAALWKDAVARTGEVVLCWDRSPVPVLINMITADWTRTDALLLKPAQIKPCARDSLRPLIARDGIYDTLAATTPIRRPDAKAFQRQVQDFIRILGLLPLATSGRADGIGNASPASRRHSASEPADHRRTKGGSDCAATPGARPRRIDRGAYGLCRGLSAARAPHGRAAWGRLAGTV